MRTIAEGGQHPVGQVVPVVQHAVRSPSQKAAAEHDVRDVVSDQVDQRGDLSGIVLEVGVLNDHDVAGGTGEAGADRGSLARVLLVPQADETGVSAR